MGCVRAQAEKDRLNEVEGEKDGLAGDIEPEWIA